MKQHTLSVDVYASWGDVAPRYRVYVDNDLLTERDFVWNGTERFIRENMIVNLRAGSHTLRVEQINTGGNIRTENIMLDSQSSSLDFVIPE